MPPPDSDRAAVASALRGARRVLLTSHENVDADGAGSALALARGLRATGIETAVAFPTPLPRSLRFLPGSDRALAVPGDGRLPAPWDGPDTVVSLDCGAAGRLGVLLPTALGAGAFLNVDHHAGNERFGTRAWVDPGYAATGLMALDLLRDLAIPLDGETALCLYTALVTDTGHFAYSNTDPRSHEAAAAFLEAGVRPEQVTRWLDRRRTEGSWRLEAEATAGLRTSRDGAIAWLSVSAGMAARHGVPMDELPDLVRIPVSLERTLVALLFTDPGEGRPTRVSLRSRCPLGVHGVAARFGGGGHPRAAGCSFPGPLAAAETALVAAVETALFPADDSGPPPQDA